MRLGNSVRVRRILAMVALPAIFLLIRQVSHEPIAYASAAPSLTNPDAVCRGCHREIYDKYEQTPMARGSGLAVDGLDPAELAASDLVHAPSGVTYHVGLKGSEADLTYRRRAGSSGPPIEGERNLDYFIGSGRRGRTFLYQQDGFWFEAPINWYGKKQLWDMAPAYDNVRTMPAPLPVDPNCLHCHVGGVEESVGGARNHYAGAPFRSPGVGCAACHGNPAAHLAATARPAAPGQHPGSANTIVNPAHLSPAPRDSVCLQCHLEGDAAVYLPGKSLAAFRPGDDLSRSVIYFIDNARAGMGGRATSQYEALLRSACKRAAGDRLTCTTCHDPHTSPAPAERVAFFREKCLACHTGEAMATKHHPEQQDCAVCHMPTRKTLDISHEQLTDHDIELPRSAAPATLSDLSHIETRDLVPVGGVAASDRELGLAYAQLAQHGDRRSGERALLLLQKAEREGASDPEVMDQLGFLLQLSGSGKAAAEHYRSVLRERPHDTTAAANLAVLQASRGDSAGAIALLKQVVRDDPAQTAAGLNLAFLECGAGLRKDALLVVQRMMLFNPDSAAAHRFLEQGTYGDQRCPLQ